TAHTGVTSRLKRHVRLNKATVLVVGNGGAARGAVFALAAAGSKLAVTGRNLDRVRALASTCGAEALSRDQAQARMFTAVVHATPLGMSPNTEKCFFENRIPSKLVFDMVYTPMDTMLLRRAKDQGAEVIAGLEMFPEQAARQFEIFTGERPPRAVMQQAALEAGAGRGNGAHAQTDNSGCPTPIMGAWMFPDDSWRLFLRGLPWRAHKLQR